jgi:hypothetical protein
MPSPTDETEEALRKINAILISAPTRVHLPAGWDIYGGKKERDDALEEAGFGKGDADGIRSYLKNDLSKSGLGMFERSLVN